MVVRVRGSYAQVCEALDEDKGERVNRQLVSHNLIRLLDMGSVQINDAGHYIPSRNSGNVTYIEQEGRWDEN